MDAFLQPVKQAHDNNKLCNVTNKWNKMMRNNHVWMMSSWAHPTTSSQVNKVFEYAIGAVLFRTTAKVKASTTRAIMHIWYLKSPCLMVIFVLNWIYYKMCSDMKHVAAGPLLLSDASARRKKRHQIEENKQNIWVIAANSPRLTSSLEASGVNLSLQQAKGEKNK